MTHKKFLKGTVSRVEVEGEKVFSTVTFEKNDTLKEYESIRILGDLGIRTNIAVTVEWTDAKTATPLEHASKVA